MPSKGTRTTIRTSSNQRMDLQTAIFQQACQEYDSGLGYYDFINDGMLFEQQFIDHIKGDGDHNAGHANINNYIPHQCCPDNDLMMFNCGLGENQFNYNPPTQDYLFDFMSSATSDPSSILLNPLPAPMNEEVVKGGVNEDESQEGDGDQGENDGSDNSSGTTATTTTTTTTTSAKRTTVDRSKTLVSERKRRGRMKEKLYSLRSLVPNITKMDKASIIGDAVAYVQDLQVQAKKIKAEIEGLESSIKGAADRFQSFFEQPKKTQVADYKNRIIKTILQMDLFQVEERGFYVRIQSNKGDGVAASLFKALESLICVDIQNSNFTTASERFILTSTIHVREGNEGINISNLKMWVSKALLNQGFEFRAPTVPSL